MNLKELGANLGLEEDEFRELVELFLETGRANFEQLQAALETGDAGSASRNAHTLCGAAGNLGIMTIYEVAKRIELDALDNHLDGVSTDIQTLSELFDEVAQGLRP